MEKIIELQKQEQPQQRTQEWYLQRNKRITASEASSCLTRSELYCKNYVEEFNIKNFKYSNVRYMNPYKSRDEYILDKCKASYGHDVFFSNDAMKWGNKYENVAFNLYSNIYNTKVYEFGLLKHPKLNWIGASPDGISDKGILLEIKCPTKRQIGGTPPLYYWVQMQIQMEVCDIDYCDFMECLIEEIDFEKWKTLEISENFQHVGILIDKNNEEYIYSDDGIFEKQDYIKWSNEIIKNNENFKPIYFFVKKYTITRVKRSKEWFENSKEQLENTFKKINEIQNDRIMFDNLLEKHGCEDDKPEEDAKCIL